MSIGIGLIESMYANVGGAPRLEAHLKRLYASADALGIPCDRDFVEARVEEALKNVYVPSKVRLVLDHDGHPTVDTVALLPLPDNPVAIIANLRLPADDPLLRHKTTRRAVYDRERARLGDVENGYDVIFLNDRDEVAEGAISNVFARFGSDYVTPPLDCGLLPSVMRAEMIAATGAQESILTLDNVRAADEVILTNAVRGPVSVTVDFDVAD